MYLFIRVYLLDRQAWWKLDISRFNSIVNSVNIEWFEDERHIMFNVLTQVYIQGLHSVLPCEIIDM